MANRSPATDAGTVIFHAIIVVAFLVLALTGARIASDEPGLSGLRLLDPLLPMENVWVLHMLAAIGLTAGIAGYFVYIVKARLTARTRLDRGRLTALFRPGRAWFAAASVLVHWLTMLAIAAEIFSGSLLFLSGGMAANALHLYASGALILLPLLHVVLHWRFGGLGQLLRIVRPSALVIQPPPPDFAALLAKHLADPAADRRLTADMPEPARGAALVPLLVGILVACAVAAGLLGFEWSTRRPLIAARIAGKDAPKLDGDLADAAWSKANVETIWTEHGGNFSGGATAGTGQSVVEVRAVHDNAYAYFAFTWSDPTRSLKHLPLVKRAGGWQLAGIGQGPDENASLAEDKFSVLIASPGVPLIGAAIHLSRSPLGGVPGGRSGRGLHYTKASRIADVWEWRAAHGGTIVDCHFGPPAAPTAGQIAGRQNYQGGYSADPGEAGFEDNFKRLTVGQTGRFSDLVQPLRLPRHPAATLVSLSSIRDDANVSESEDARWWLSAGNSVPFSAAADAAVPVGTVIPSILIDRPESGDRADVVGIAQWNSGRWTLELARKLDTGSANDVAIRSGDLLWVAAFDHSETRHTRHLRPLILELLP